MNSSWDKSVQKRYEELIDQQMRDSGRLLLWLGVTLFPLFSVLDYSTQREHLAELLTIRFSTTFLLMGLFPFFRKGSTFPYPFAVCLVLLGIAAFSITLMCWYLGGFGSPYYAGVNLVILAGALLLPLTGRRMFYVMTFLLANYFLTIYFLMGFQINDPEGLINNFYFLSSTGIIGVAGAILKEKTRKELFASKDLLQQELQSEQSNVELLVKEITEKKSELEKSLVLREEFISLASHELNTPLTSLNLQTQYAVKQISEGKTLDPKSIVKIINIYDSQLQRLIRIVNDMLDISRIRSGKMVLETAPMDLGVLVKDVIVRISPKFTAEGVSLTLKETEGLHGQWDRFRIEQVVINLLTNALKYGNKKPVFIELLREECFAVIKIKDQGIGIAEENKAKIFEQFERAVKPQEFSGLGLGLYICKQIIEAHNGAIEVESTVGQGSTFIVKLPMNP